MWEPTCKVHTPVLLAGPWALAIFKLIFHYSWVIQVQTGKHTGLFWEAGAHKGAAVLWILHREAVWDQGLERGKQWRQGCRLRWPQPHQRSWSGLEKVLLAFHPDQDEGLEASPPSRRAHEEEKLSSAETLRSGLFFCIRTPHWLPEYCCVDYVLGCVLSEGSEGDLTFWNGLISNLRGHAFVTQKNSAEWTLPTHQTCVFLVIGILATCQGRASSQHFSERTPALSLAHWRKWYKQHLDFVCVPGSNMSWIDSQIERV